MEMRKSRLIIFSQEQSQPRKCREKIKQQLKLYDGGPCLNKGKLK